MMDLSQEQINKIMSGMEAVNREMADEIERAAPTCCFRKMALEEEDCSEGYGERWWECSVCGHTKDY